MRRLLAKSGEAQGEPDQATMGKEEAGRVRLGINGKKGEAAVPKSASLSSPLSLMSRFWGLRSRCSTFCRWQ